MTTEDFWTIVHQARRLAGEEVALAALTAELARRGERAISGFDRQARREIAHLDIPEVRDVAEQLWVISDDAWLHLRAWCVSQGEEFVARVKTAPGRTLRVVAERRAGPFDPPSGELFLYCTEYARVARTGATV